MARPTGRPKTGGRRKGTPNKKTLLAKELLESINCDPLQGMAQIAMDKKIPVELRAKMYAELAQYSYPKVKANDINVGVQVNTMVRPEDFVRVISEAAKREGIEQL